MKILTHDSLKAAGGIHRRIREMNGYADRLSKDISFVVLKLNETESVITENKFRYYHLKNPGNIGFRDPYKGLNSTSEMEERFGALTAMANDIVEKEKPDAFLLMGTFFLPWALLQTAKKYGIPVVHIYVGSTLTELYPLGGPLTAHYKPLEFDFIANTDYTVFNSRHASQKIMELFGRLPEHYSVIWNGINEHMFNGKPKPDRRGIGYVARYDLFKNPNLLLEIDTKLKAAGIELPIHVLSNLHQGIPAYWEYKKAGFMLYPQTSQDAQLREFYQSRVMTILPSKFETFGNVAMETLAAGVPCLVSNGVGSSEVYKELGLEHLIFSPDNIGEIYGKVMELERTKLEIEPPIRARLRALCNWEDTINGYMAAIFKVLGGNYAPL